MTKKKRTKSHDKSGRHLSGRVRKPSGDSPGRQQIPVRVFALLFGAVLAIGSIGVITFRSMHKPPPTLPQLQSNIVGGKNRAVIDRDALATFADQHHLPQIPDLTTLSWRAASDVYGALTEVATALPEDSAAVGQLGRVFHSHDYPQQALACYVRAQSISPSDYKWAYYIGRIHADALELNAAVDAYEQAGQLNDSYAPTYLALGNVYSQLGNEEKAQEAFRRFNSLRPRSSHGYLGLAQICYSKREFAAAIDFLESALKRNPSDFRVHNLLGQVYQQLGKTDLARRHLAQVKGVNQKDQLAKQVHFDDPLYHQVLAANSTDVALDNRLRAAMGTGQSDVAIGLAEQLCLRYPKDANWCCKLAAAYKQAKRFDDSIRCAERAIGLDSNHAEAHLIKAQLLMIGRRHAEALDVLELVVQLDPDSFDAQYNRGAAQVLSNKYHEAVVSFRSAIRLRGDSARAHVALAETLMQLGQRPEAIKAYQRALELDPINKRALQQLNQR